jgi:DNA-binding MarR family transcriptional regulator
MSNAPFVERSPYWINRAAFAFRSELQLAFSRDGIEVTPEEWSLQMVLFEQAPLSIGQLARLTLRDRTTVTRFVEALERKGLIVRTNDPADRRRTLVQLSKKGHAHFPHTLKHVERLIARGNRGLTEQEVASTISVLARMVDNLSKDDQ